VYITKYVNALTLRRRAPQNNIKKNIPIIKLSKKQLKKNKSKELKVNNKNTSKPTKTGANNINLLSFQHKKPHNIKINVVNITKYIDNPSKPSMKDMFILGSHFNTNKYWNP